MRQINRDHDNQDDNEVLSDTPPQRSQATTIKKSTFKKKKSAFKKHWSQLKRRGSILMLVGCN